MGVGAGFLFLVWGAGFADGNFQVGLAWLAGLYLIHSIAELCISPVGLSMITKLSIARIVGLMMGVWFLSISVAQYVAGAVAQVASVETVGGQVTNLQVSLDTYAGVFWKIGLVSVGIGAAAAASFRRCSRGGCMASNRLRGLLLALTAAGGAGRLRRDQRRRRQRDAHRRRPPRAARDGRPTIPILRPTVPIRACRPRSPARPSSTARAGGSRTARSCWPTAGSRRSAAPTRRSPRARPGSTGAAAG